MGLTFYTLTPIQSVSKHFTGVLTPLKSNMKHNQQLKEVILMKVTATREKVCESMQAFLTF